MHPLRDHAATDTNERCAERARSLATDRAQAFSRLPRAEALALFPELAASYATLDDLRRQIAWRSAAAQAAVIALATESMLERLRAGHLPPVVRTR